MAYPRNVNRPRGESGFDLSNVSDPAVRESLGALDQSVKTLFKSQGGVSVPEDAPYDYQHQNNGEFDRTWKAIRDLQDKRGSGGGGGGLSIPTVTELPPVGAVAIVYLDSDIAGNKQKWGSNPGDTRWYPMEKLTSGDGAEGMV